MRKFFRTCMTSFLAFALLLTGIPFAGAAAASGIKDLVIDLNVPQVTRDVKDNKIQLNALHVYEDGRFMLASENLTWKSSNKNVAAVKDGEVTLSGHNGKTFISVSDGSFTDRMAIQFKGNQGEILMEKEKGSRYDLIGDAIQQMTMEEKVGQMLMPDFRTWKGQNVTEMNAEISALVKKYHLGGVILFRENTVTAAQTTKLVSAYQDAAEKYGLLISVDQEGGIVTRLQFGTDFPGNMALGASRSEELAEKVGRAIGEELDAVGINMNFGPVLDVNNNPDNPVIGVRSFGEDPELVAKMGNAYIKGLHETGTAATAKHFPGHGDTATDSHLGLPEVPHDIDRLKKVELYPFQQAMDAGIDAVMSAHVTFPKIDRTKAISKKDGTEIAIPGTLSHKVLTGLMREEMGFKGVIVTDAMNMQAIADHFGPVDAAVRAVKAGTDIVLMPVGLESVANGLYDAVNSGDIPEERLDQSVERILTLKLNRGIVKAEVEKSLDEKVANAKKVARSAEHLQVEKEAAAKSITLVKNNGVLPLKATAEDKMVVVGSSASVITAEVKKHHPNVTVIDTAAPLSAANLAIAKTAKYIIVGTNTSTVSGRLPSANLMKLANQMMEQTDAAVIAVGLRNPYDMMAYPNVDAYLTQYGTKDVSFEAAVNTIFAVNQPTGKLPVTIYNQDGSVIYGFGHGLGY
ncbi:glycoside hydrolase family 3 C-terminal domain-containing protein [Neobacillus sp. MM2021_6]|uniref:glycoside hydrolase family 3 protein n=1 Tax=Bacillaceae TaxID=186817 RepID=UPI00140A82BA|nr:MULTISPECIES: glycoside hydrolase family 3 protein [Bacillaceae]MBO0958636.1 glycoside hydrolase family 3 C-terminal domain-containing protein [Neobacillus sp. MM2021_6]NHC20223.1 glycoside hydrolase family 3 protein [Bacillus sp. MM2020_4]